MYLIDIAPICTKTPTPNGESSNTTSGCDNCNPNGPECDILYNKALHHQGMSSQTHWQTDNNQYSISADISPSINNSQQPSHPGTGSCGISTSSGGIPNYHVKHPKHPLNAFMVWSSRHRKRIAEQKPQLRLGENSKILGNQRRLMADEDKL